MTPLAIRKERLNIVQTPNFLGSLWQIWRQIAFVELVDRCRAHAEVQVVKDMLQALTNRLGIHIRCFQPVDTQRIWRLRVRVMQVRTARQNSFLACIYVHTSTPPGTGTALSKCSFYIDC